MAPEEPRDLAEGLLRLGHERIEELGVALALEDLENRLDPCLAQPAMRAHGVAEEEIPRPGGQDRGGKPRKSPWIGDTRGSVRSCPAA